MYSLSLRLTFSLTLILFLSVVAYVIIEGKMEEIEWKRETESIWCARVLGIFAPPLAIGMKTERWTHSLFGSQFIVIST